MAKKDKQIQFALRLTTAKEANIAPSKPGILFRLKSVESSEIVKETTPAEEGFDPNLYWEKCKKCKGTGRLGRGQKACLVCDNGWVLDGTQ